MNDRRFPNWTAPFVGAFFGVGLGLKGAATLPDMKQDVWSVLFCIAAGAGCGGAIGMLVYLIAPTERDSDVDPFPNDLRHRGAKHPSQIIGRFLALAGIATFWAPIIGLVVALIALILNRESDDWARPASLIGLILGVLTLLALATLLIAESIRIGW